MTIKHSIAVLLFTFIAAGSAGTNTYRAASCMGIERHSIFFENEIKRILPELNRTASDNGETGTFAISCSVSVRESDLLAIFEITDISADTVTLWDLIAYHDISDIGPVTALFSQRLINDSLAAPPHRPVTAPPVITLPNYNAAVTSYRSTEQTWMEQGAPLPEWHKYYSSQSPITEWAQRHRFNERTATMLGILPCSSGHLYTRQVNIGLFWSISELALLAYGLTRSDPFQRGALLTALIPLTALDGIMSRISARKTNEITSSIESLYPDRKYPFKFMGTDSNPE